MATGGQDMFEHERSTFDIKNLMFSLPNADGDTVIHTLVEKIISPCVVNI